MWLLGEVAEERCLSHRVGLWDPLSIQRIEPQSKTSVALIDTMLLVRNNANGIQTRKEFLRVRLLIFVIEVEPHRISIAGGAAQADISAPAVPRCAGGSLDQKDTSGILFEDT